MSFLRHGEIYRSDVVNKTIADQGPGAAFRGRPRGQTKDATEKARPAHRPR